MVCRYFIQINEPLYFLHCRSFLVWCNHLFLFIFIASIYLFIYFQPPDLEVSVCFSQYILLRQVWYFGLETILNWPFYSISVGEGSWVIRISHILILGSHILPRCYLYLCRGNPVPISIYFRSLPSSLSNHKFTWWYCLFWKYINGIIWDPFYFSIHIHKYIHMSFFYCLFFPMGILSQSL